MAERDKQADIFEGQTFYTRDPKFPNNEIQRFLSDGLDKSYVRLNMVFIVELRSLMDGYSVICNLDKEYESPSKVVDEQ
jgi:hypothetical protein